MKRTHLFFAAALSVLGLSAGLGTSPVFAAKSLPPIGTIAQWPLLAKIGSGTGGRSISYRWPYSGKNRAQRHRLNAGFCAMA